VHVKTLRSQKLRMLQKRQIGKVLNQLLPRSAPRPRHSSTLTAAHLRACRRDLVFPEAFEAGLEFHEWQGSDGPQYGNVVPRGVGSETEGERKKLGVA
jgi:hypothetical protein